MKKQIIFIIGILFLLNLAICVSALGYSEDENGTPFYKSEFEIRTPSVNINNLITLNPSSQPAEPKLGMIYLDSISKRLEFYNGEEWYAIALEKISTIPQQQAEKAIVEKNAVQACEKSVSCGEWGDCINNYQAVTCITTDEVCNKHTDIKTRDCVPENFSVSNSAVTSNNTRGASENASPSEIIPPESTSAEATSPSEPATTEAIPNETVPEQLFDITFDLEQTILGKNDKLVVWVTLQNFGTQYVPARLIYTIKDKTGNEIYKEIEETRVYTNQFIVKTFDNLVLEDGEYTLSMNLEYSGIVEKFSKNFSVETGLINSIKRFFKNLF
jgi:hypothetical protein